MKFNLTLSLLTLSFCPAIGAVVAYSEDFTGQGGDGITGQNGGIVDTGYTAPGAIWSLTDVDLGAFTATTDWVRVESGVAGTLVTGDALSFRDNDGPVKWLSPVINISALTSLGLTMDIEEDGDLEPDNYIDIAYILDGGTPVVMNLGGQYSNGTNTYAGDIGAGGVFDDADFLTDQFSGSIPDGSTLQIQIIGLSDAGTEELFFDNILVMGENAIPEPSSSLMIVLCGGLGLLRRRRS